MAIEKRERSGHGFLCCFWVVAGARVVIESMARVIPTDLHLGMGCVHLLDVSLGNMTVVLAEVKQDRHAGGFQGKPADLAAVVADCGGW
jgi:hypothetical protein